MEKTRKLSDRLIEARKKRGWSVEEAAKRANMHHYALRNLEGAIPGRVPPRGGDIKVWTMLELTRIYWPDLQVDDWVDRRTLLRFTPRDSSAKETLKYGRKRDIGLNDE